MLQHWVSEGEFYIGGFVLHTWHKKKYHIGRVFRYTQKHFCRTFMERHKARNIYIVKIRAIEETKGSLHLQLY